MDVRNKSTVSNDTTEDDEDKTDSADDTSMSSERTRWRFLQNASSSPTTTSTTTNANVNAKQVPFPFKVVFAGPHFQAALPAVQNELRRRYDEADRDDGSSPSSNHVEEVGSSGGGSDVDEEIIIGGIQLVPAPTLSDLDREIQTAHVAIPFMERFSQQLLHNSTSPYLQLVIQFGVGLEGVDMDQATSSGIVVSNVPAHLSGNAQATSEHAIWLAISMLRKSYTEYTKRLHNGVLGGLPIPRTLFGKHVTVVGFGAVGKIITKYLVVMGAHVTVVKRRPWSTTTTSEPTSPSSSMNDNDKNTDGPSDEWLLNSIQKETSLHRAIPTADIIFLACPVTSDTIHCINEETIQRMKQGCIVVNIARGGLVEYNSMLHALQSNHIGGYASDVGIDGINTTTSQNNIDDTNNNKKKKPSEPWDPHDIITTLPNTLFTPHVGGYSDLSYDNMASHIVDAIECIRKGQPPPVWVNKDKDEDED